MNNLEKYREIEISRINELIDIVSNQIHFYDGYVVYTLRNLVESLWNYIYDVKTNYSDFDKEFHKNKWITYARNFNSEKNSDSDFDEIYPIFKKLSEILHYKSFRGETNISISSLTFKEIIENINSILLKHKLIIINLPEPFKEIGMRITADGVTIERSSFSKIEGQNFIVPVYQRKFTWDQNDIIQLFDSIRETDGIYDLGLIYLTDKLEIIDGQQRIHSLYIIIKLLMKIKGYDNYKLSIERSRGLDNWRCNFSIMENILNSAQNHIEFKLLYNHLKNYVDHKPIDHFLNVQFDIKKIYSEEGPMYFYKINNFGQKINIIEELLSKMAYKFLNGKYRDDNLSVDFIYEFWSATDILSSVDGGRRISRIRTFSNNKLIFLENLIRENFDDALALDYPSFMIFINSANSLLENTMDNFLFVNFNVVENINSLSIYNNNLKNYYKSLFNEFVNENYPDDINLFDLLRRKLLSFIELVKVDSNFDAIKPTFFGLISLLNKNYDFSNIPLYNELLQYDMPSISNANKQIASTYIAEIRVYYLTIFQYVFLNEIPVSFDDIDSKITKFFKKKLVSCETASIVIKNIVDEFIKGNLPGKKNHSSTKLITPTNYCTEFTLINSK